MQKKIAGVLVLFVLAAAFIFLLVLIKKQDRDLRGAKMDNEDYQTHTDKKIAEMGHENRLLEQKNSDLRNDFIRLNAVTAEELEKFQTTGQDMKNMVEWQAKKMTELANNFDAYKDRLHKIYAGASYLVHIKATFSQEREVPMPGLGKKYSCGELAGFVIRGHDKDKKECIYIVTAAHLLGDIDNTKPYTTDITVTYDFGKEKTEAELYAHDRNYDVALLTFKDPAYVYKGSYAEFGKSDDVLPGNEVIALGSPNRDPYCISLGLMSSRTKDFPASRDLILHTAGITFGNSGGPLLNSDSKIIGMNIQIQMVPLDGMGLRMAVSPFSIALSSRDILFIMPELERGVKY